MDNWLQRTSLLVGEESVLKLKKSKVVVLGVGGVGSFSIEALVRAGIGNITIVDKDTVDITNINRQIHANVNSIGKVKVEVMRKRMLEINPTCNVTAYKAFIEASNIEDIIDKETDYVIDAIDTVSSKISVITWCKNNGINIISSMGTGNKLDPTKFKIEDIYDTKVCPLAKVMRNELRKRKIEDLKVLYSEEKPIKREDKILNSNNRPVPASISFVPSCAGLIIGGEVIKDIIKTK